MSDSPCTRSGLFCGPSATVQGVGQVVIIPASVTGGKRLKRLISVLVIVETVAGPNIVLTPAGVTVLLNGSKNVRYGDLGAGKCLLDKTVNNRIVFNDALGANTLIWFQYIGEDQQRKAVIVPT